MPNKFQPFILLLFIAINSFSQQQTIDSLSKALRVQQADSNKIKTLNHLAFIIKNEKPEEAIRYSKEAIALAEKLNYTKGFTSSFLTCAKANLNTGHAAEAFHYIQRSFALNTKNGDAEGLALTYSCCGEAYTTEHNIVKAEENYKAALKIYRQLGNKKSTARLLYLLGSLNVNEEKFILSLDKLLEAAKIQNEIKDEEGLAISYYLLGRVSEGVGHYPEALKYLFASLKLIETGGDKKKVVDIYNGIGIIYCNLEKYQDAKRNYLIALKINREMGLNDGMALLYNNLGNVNWRMGKHSEALQLYDSALFVLKKIPNLALVADAYLNIGSVYIDLQDYKEGMRYCMKALEVQEKIKDYIGIATNYTNISICYIRLKEYTKAREYLNKSFALTTEMSIKNEMPHIYQNLALLDSCTGDYKKAFEHIKMYHLYLDSLVNEENKIKSVQTEMEYFFNKKTSLDSLKSLKEKLTRDEKIALDKIEIDREKSQFWIVLIASFLLIVSLVFLYKRFRISEKQKAIIGKQNQEYDLLLREIHHRVKNNLQVISSIIDLEGMRQSDQQAIASFNDVRSRIMSISLVHGVLYDQKELQQIEIASYFKLLFNSMKKMHDTQSVQLHGVIKIPELWLNTSQLIPMALIVTELISNSFKHANTVNNEIQIELEITKDEHALRLLYFDSGTGTTEKADPFVSKTMGMRLIALLTKQLGGTVTPDTSSERFGYLFTFKA